MTIEQQRTFGALVEMEEVVPTKRHNEDCVECSDGSICLHRDVCYDTKGSAHSNEDDAMEADVTIVEEILNGVEKRATENTKNTDYADGCVHIVDEMSHEWRKHVDEWVRAYLGIEDDIVNQIVDSVFEDLDVSFDAEPEYHHNEYATYGGKGCCLASFEIGEIEEQVDIFAFDVLKDLHDEGRLDDVLDHVNCDLYISRDRRRERNEKTGYYEPVGRESYNLYNRDHPHLNGYTSPGGQWMWVVSQERMRELIESAINAYAGFED
jgi:hypothetical protein